MNIEPLIFKAYDIRGIYPKEINKEFAYALGRAYATFLNAKDTNLKIVVGSDMRLSSPELKESLINGLLDSGVNVIDAGLVSTPTFYFTVSYYGYDGGIQVSASHNPPEYNGFKMVRPKAIPISGDTGIQELRKIIESENYIRSNIKGTLTKKDNLVPEEIAIQKEGLPLNKVKPFKVVVDTANSMGILDIKEIFKYVPCEVIYINSELDGTFPNHMPNPTEAAALEQLREKILEHKADLGIAIDGDGDRYFYLDEQGNNIRQDVLRGIIAESVLKDFPNSKIAYDIRPGKITVDLITRNGGIPVVTKVGHSLIKEKMLQEDAVYGGESSGHYFFRKDYGTYEMPAILTYRFLIYISEHNLPVSKVIEPFLIYPQSGEINSNVADPTKVFETLKVKYSDAKNISELDGLTIEYDDFWFNVRGSNTEHGKLRLNLEAINNQVMEEKRDEVLNVIRSL